jgi:hypothetical protein
MNPHLSPQEFVDAAEGTLTAPRRSHVEACSACGGQVASLRQVMSDVDLAAAVPEPSPLFWEHFSQRVRLATSVEAPAAPARWWLAWRPLSVGALLAAAVMLIAVQVHRAPAAASHVEAVVSDVPAVDASAAEDASWDLMVTMASDLSADDLHHFAAPMTGVADTMGASLTPAEQKELVRLIRREMGGAE